MIIPTSFGDSQEICDHLLAGKAVVLNMEGLHTEIAQRIIDFASGAVYSINGNLFRTSWAMWETAGTQVPWTCQA